MSSIAVIGSGVAGLASAALAANKGYDVSVFEANSSVGERQVKFVRPVFDLTEVLRCLRCPKCSMSYSQHVVKSLRLLQLLKTACNYKIFLS